MATQGPAPVDTGIVPLVVRPLDRSPAAVPPGPGTTGQIPTVARPQGPPESAPPSVAPGPGTGQSTESTTAVTPAVIELPVDTTSDAVASPNIIPTVPNYIEVLANGIVVVNNSSALNFTGTGVQVTANGAVAAINISGGGDYGNSNVVLLLSSFGSNTVSTTGNITGGYLFGNGSQLTGLSATYGNANVVANLAALGTNPVSTTGNITGGYLFGNGSQLTGLPATYGNANVVANLAALGTNPVSTAGNIIGAAANIPSIVSVSLDVENISARIGNNGVNIGAGGYNNLVVLPTEVLIQNVPLSVAGNITGSYLFGNGSQLTGLPATYGNANVAANLAAFADNPILTTGNIGAGNINVTTATGNLVFGRASATGSPGINSTSSVTVVTDRFGTPKEWTFGSDGSFAGLGNISGGNVNTGVVANTGNLSLTSGANSWTFDTTGNLTVPGSIILPPNTLITGNFASPAPRLSNFDSVSAANLSASGNVNSVTMSASGNVTGGNVNTNTLVGTSTTIKSTGALNLSATGNIVVNSTYINNLSDPVQNQDAATKNYVDTVAQGLNIHQAANLASTQDLATYTGATVTYDNGTSGVGATLSLVGNTLTTLDGTAIPASASTRLLIKNQANAVLNGVYSYTSSSLLTRTTDTDTSAGLAGGDFLFVTSGSTQADTGWIQTTDNVVVGTSNVAFSQFSSAGAYAANTSAGLALNGSIFSAKVDDVTTAFDGSGNIIVKASANLTTPNIGAATGSSLSVTGNITGGNILGGANVNATTHTGTTVSVTGNVTGGNANITSTTASTSKTTGALTVGGGIGVAGDLYAGNSVTVDGGAYGNVTTTQYASVFGHGAGPNPYSVMQVRSSDGASGMGMQAFTGSGTLYGNTNIIFALGTIRDKDIPSSLVTKAYIDSTGLSVTGIVSASGNVTGGNLITAGAISAASVSASGNVTGGNLVTAAAVSAASVSASGNVTGGNILTGGLISSTGNITGGNIVTAAAVSAASVSASGNITGGNINTGAQVVATGNITGGNLRSTSLSLSGNVISALNVSSSIAAGTTISAVGNVTGGNVTTAGLTSTASLSITGNTATVTSANYSIGYLTIPQVTLSANATAGLTDIGKHFYSTTSGNLQITIPDNANVAFPVGTAISVVVQAAGNVLVVTQPSTTLYLSGNATSGNRVVGSYGMATIMKVASGTWFISGTGVS